MKRVLAIALAVVGFAGAANGAVLSMYFPGGAEEWTTYPSDSVEVEVYLDLNAGEHIGTVWFEFEAVAGLWLTSTSPAAPGWGALGVMGDLSYAGGPQAAYGAEGQEHAVVGPATAVLIGTFTVHQAPGPQPWQDYELMFTSVPGPVHATLMNTAAVDLTWHPGYAATYSGYWTYGKGASDVPGSKMYPALTKDPLIVHYIPEPGSLSLLALGGLLVAWRRR